MSGDPSKLPPGRVGWRDLTVPDADRVRRFYEAVVGWRSESSEGDFNMFAPGSANPVAGICHAKGPNANLPPVGLIYVIVKDLNESVATATKLGGRLVDGPRPVGNGAMCVIQDPASASVALFQPPTE